MADETARVAAFVEYVLRPLSEDWKLILEQLKSLNIGITQNTIKQITFGLGLWHLFGEIIRGLTYITIVWLVCQVLPKLLC